MTPPWHNGGKIRLVGDDLDLERGPQWAPGEVARVFFGKDSNWLRHHHRRGHLVLDGEPLEVRRLVPKDPKKETPLKDRHRFFYLSDVEQVALALHVGRFLTDRDLRLAQEVIRLQARVWELV